MTVLMAIVVFCLNGGLSKSEIFDRVDLMELNHFYDDKGLFAYSQLIFYEWSPDYRRYHVRAWCMVERDLSRIPIKTRSGEYVVRWEDRDAKCNRKVVADIFIETHTDVDPERINKKFLDEKFRNPLTKPTLRECPKTDCVKLEVNGVTK